MDERKKGARREGEMIGGTFTVLQRAGDGCDCNFIYPTDLMKICINHGIEVQWCDPNSFILANLLVSRQRT